MPAQTEWEKRRQRIDARGGSVDLDDDTSLGLFGTPEWIGVAATAVLVLALAFVPPVATPLFETMYRDVGGHLPGITRAFVDFSHFLSDWHVHLLCGLPFAIVPAAVLVVGILVPTFRLSLRRGFIAGAFILGCLLLGTYVWVMYQPLAAPMSVDK